MKRYIALLLTVAWAGVAFAASETIDGVTWQYYISNNEAIIYNNGYSAIPSSTTGAVAVPPALGGCPVVAIGYAAFYRCGRLTHVAIPASVREIGGNAFYSCTGLTVITLPENLTMLGTSAFCDCTGLTRITIPSTVKTVCDSAFYQCSAMTDVTISEGVETIGTHAFYGCSKLERVVLPSTIRSVKQNVFYGCSSMGSVVLPEGLVELQNGAFQYCSKLASVTIPSTVTTLGDSCFYGCGLKKATIKAALTALPSLFSYCRSLQVVVLPETIEAIYGSFYECNALTDVNIPDGVTNISAHAFYNCSSLVDFKIPSGVTKIQDYTFWGCTKLIGIDFPEGLQSIGSGAFYNCASLTHADIPEGVTLINANAFVGCTGLERITLPGSINTMASGAFNCPSATVIFKGGVPNYSVLDAGLLNSKAISYPREYGAAWQKVLGTAQFGGYTQTQEELPEVVIVSAQMRPTDSTILDVVYRVKSKDPKVHVRVLAFENGIRSFANVIRPETFEDGTEENVGDNITANEDHTISWRVSADWKTDLSKMKFEVLAMRNNYIPLELITIPAIEGHAAMTITWNTLSPAQIINALYWIYADKDANFTVVNGNLMKGSTMLMQGAKLCNSNASITYIYSKMGYSVLSGDKLTYARSATRLPLADNPDCPFAVKND